MTETSALKLVGAFVVVWFLTDFYISILLLPVFAGVLAGFDFAILVSRYWPAVVTVILCVATSLYLLAIPASRPLGRRLRKVIGW